MRIPLGEKKRRTNISISPTLYDKVCARIPKGSFSELLERLLTAWLKREMKADREKLERDSDDENATKIDAKPDSSD